VLLLLLLLLLLLMLPPQKCVLLFMNLCDPGEAMYMKLNGKMPGRHPPPPLYLIVHKDTVESITTQQAWDMR
jgi:hypothetical protein